MMPRQHQQKELEEAVAERVNHGSGIYILPMDLLEEAEVLHQSLVGRGGRALLVELIPTAATTKQCNVRQVLVETLA
jgi:hypothetical protein